MTATAEPTRCTEMVAHHGGFHTSRCTNRAKFDEIDGVPTTCGLHSTAKREATRQRQAERYRAEMKRLIRAIEAGAVFPNPVVKHDVNGATFVSSDLRVIGRRLNADLKRLGF